MRNEEVRSDYRAGGSAIQSGEQGERVGKEGR